MGSKLEYILITAIAFVLLLPFGINVKNRNSTPKKTEQKSSEISNFTEYEINASSLEHTLKAKSAKEVNRSWILSSPVISTDKIKSLSAKRSVANSQKIEFFDNVVAKKADGTVYKTGHAIYNTKTKELITPENFTINRQLNIVHGKNLQYDAKTKTTKAKDVNGTIILKNRD